MSIKGNCSVPGGAGEGKTKKRMILNELSSVLRTQSRGRTGTGCPTGV